MQGMMDKKWEQRLKTNNLSSFDDFWKLEKNWFEPVNERRGGWSGVTYLEVKGKHGKPYGIYIKRQENHTFRVPRFPYKKLPTFEREFDSLVRLRKNHVYGPKPLFFAKRRYKGRLQCVLVTKGLKNTISLEDLLIKWSAHPPTKAQLKTVLKSIASYLHQVHQARLIHNCMYVKHILIHQNLLKPHKAKNKLSKGNGVCILDLEKAHISKDAWQGAVRDLHSLMFSVIKKYQISNKLLLSFLKCYTGTNALDATTKKLWHDIKAFNIMKNRSHYFLKTEGKQKLCII